MITPKELENSRKVETWGDFIQEWNAAQSIPGRVGLLYHGATIRIDLSGEVNGSALINFLNRKVIFYHQVSRCDEPILRDAAQQLLVKQILPQFPQLAWTVLVNPPAACNIYTITSVLLGKRVPSLVKPPYPRFVRALLKNIIDYICGNGLENFFDISLLFDSAIAWGCADLFLWYKLSSQSKDKILMCFNRDIKTLLPAKDEAVQQILSHVLQKTEPCSDLTKDSDIANAQEITHIAYFILSQKAKS